MSDAVADPGVRERPVTPADRTTAEYRSTRDVLSGPLYPKLLRLHHLNPSAWQRALLVEGVMSAGAILALADVITAWAPVVLPIAVGSVVKFHDVLIGVLGPARPGASRPTAQSAPEAAVPARPALVPAAPEQETEEMPAVRVLEPPPVPAPGPYVGPPEPAVAEPTTGVRADAEADAEARARALADAVAERDALRAQGRARKDVELLQREARELATELYRLDGTVELFALGVDPKGRVVAVDTIEAYDRVPLDRRVAALRGEIARAAAAGEIRAAALAVAADGGGALTVEIDHAATEPVEVELSPDTGTARPVGPGRGLVETWGGESAP